MQRKLNLAHVICVRMGKTTETKPHQVNLKSPLLRIHYYQNKQLQVKGISVPNTNLRRCWLQSSSVHPNDEDKKTPWLQNPWCKDTIASTKKMMN